MEQKIPILILRLEGVLQSWGESAKWDYRDTALMPTKSAVLGLTGCALGWPRGDPRLIQLAGQLHFAVRADRAGRLMNDFHTVQSERLLAASGKPRSSGVETLVTHRSYLQDACFTVALSGSRDRLEMLHYALLHPVWPVFLGRKSCVPSRPVFAAFSEEYSSMEEALSRFALAPRSDSNVLLEFESTDGRGIQRMDEVCMGTRCFGLRRVHRIPLEKEGKPTCT